MPRNEAAPFNSYLYTATTALQFSPLPLTLDLDAWVIVSATSADMSLGRTSASKFKGCAE